LFLNAHQNPTLMPLVQNDRGPIHFLVLHEKSQKTETVKNHSEVLKNPLINLNEEIQRLEELIKSTSEKQSKHSNLLSNTLHTFRAVRVVLPVTSALMVPLPLSYNLFATDCVKEVISAEVPLANKT
jgi:hypothetical protein